MKKTIGMIFFLVASLSGCAQIKDMMLKTGKVFPDTYSNEYLPFESQTRFTPTVSDAEIVETLIAEQIATLNKGMVNQGGSCPVIHDKLQSYYRQYVGYVDAKGERIVWVNFLWKKEYKKSEISEDVILVFDGCSYYWNVKVNLDKRTVFDLSVNGSA
tara:strand:- start:656 stop:1129 length:474 start_codon:yes stop_codon:yes gene_type:complete